MELHSKSKYFGFKSRKQNSTGERNWFGNTLSDENDIFENIEATTFRNKDVPRTPVRTLYCNNISPISQNSSPQFKVGWNDGSQKNSCDMSSPVSILPVRRKIRRCPENLLSKISPLNNSEQKRTDEESGCDILQCISWAKNLIESTSTNFGTSDREDDQYHNEDINIITESIKDTNLDILDDSSNELMIMCSQAIEESFSAGSLIDNAENSSSIKHSITPIRDTNSCKRFKREPSPQNQSSKTNFDHRLSLLNPKPCSSQCTEKLTKKNQHQAESSSLENKNKKDIFLKPTMTYNNNTTTLKNFNKNTNVDKTDNFAMKRQVILNQPPTTISAQINKSVSAIPDDDIKSHLDDEDDVFCSLDFNFLDLLQSQSNKSSETIPKPSKFNLGRSPGKHNEPPKIHSKPQVTKYTKEDIEKRRLEAKKRLLFNKKHRSM